MKRNLPLREFIYINKERLEDFVSPMLGGMPYEQRETSHENGAQTELGVDVQIASVKRVGSREGLSWEELRRATPASLFELLVQILRENDALQDLTAFDEAIWSQLEEEEFILAPCEVQLSALDRLFELIQRFGKMVSAISPEKLDEAAQVLQYVDALSGEQTTTNVRMCPVGAPSRRHAFVASLDADNIRSSKAALEGRFQVLGRVQQKLSRGETFELFNLLPQGIKLPRDQLKQLIAHFSNMPSMLGDPPKMEDLRVSYPAIILTPVAIFR